MSGRTIWRQAEGLYMTKYTIGKFERKSTGLSNLVHAISGHKLLCSGRVTWVKCSIDSNMHDISRLLLKVYHMPSKNAIEKLTAS